jgi:hypothetical protein
MEGDSPKPFAKVPCEGAEGGNPISERCKQCERFEKSLKELHDRRANLWRRGELTDTNSETLIADERRITEKLRVHQASAHEKTLPNLEEGIRRRAYERYELRGRQDGHDLDDWLQAEAEMTAKTTKPAAA